MSIITRVFYCVHVLIKVLQFSDKSIFTLKFRPFCGRVNVREQIGLVPTKQYGEHKTRKRQLPVLNNHKKWLEKFKHQI